jgi:hypothetical protein
MTGAGDVGLAAPGVVGGGGSVETGDWNALGAEGAAVRPGRVGVEAGAVVGAEAGAVVDAGVAVLGAGVLGLGADAAGRTRSGAGPTGRGVAPGPVTVVDDPAGTETSAPPALVSTEPDRVTTVVSPPGETVTYESDPARITEAVPELRTS